MTNGATFAALALAASAACAAQVGAEFALETRATAMNFRRDGETWLMERWGLKGPTPGESAALAYHPDFCQNEIGRVKPWTYSAFGAGCWQSADVNKFGGLAVEHADGALSLELRHVAAESAEENGATHFTLRLKDAAHPFFVTQHFVAWKDCDAIETWIELRNDEDGAVRVSRMDSIALALPLRDRTATLYSLTGDWASEGQLSESPVSRGQSVVLESRNVTRSGWGANPSFMLSMGGPATESSGCVVGCSLAWTGAFRLGVRHDFADTYELRAGVDSPNGAYVLDPGRTLALPKAIVVYSEKGRGEVSRQFHRWARRHCMPHGRDLRPILLNSWEGCYHNITEPVLLSMMDGFRDLGGELFVVDDGWYGRGDYGDAPDDAALGDWTVDPRPLPHGLPWLAGQAKERGLGFGIWVEPEMGGTRSHLVQEHPDWVMRDRSRPLRVADGTTRVVLDLPNPAVRENIFGQLDALYGSIPGLAYVKWDCNVNLQNPGSPHLPADRQANLWFDYGAGLRELLGRLNAKYPHISVQACSSGGAHMDYGCLATADEFWASDDTDARERVFIQWGVSQFYPASAMGAHVTASPNHQTGRETPLKFRLDVAMTGRLGFELHPAKLTEEEKAVCRRGISDYKRIRPVVQQGDLYRLVSPYERDYAALSYVAEDRRRATVSVLGLVRDMHSDYPAPIRLEGLDPEVLYRVREINLDGEVRHTRVDGMRFSGAALMNQGFYPLLRHDYDSFTLELSAETTDGQQGGEEQ